jgi:hypothetical protein
MQYCSAQKLRNISLQWLHVQQNALVCAQILELSSLQCFTQWIGSSQQARNGQSPSMLRSCCICTPQSLSQLCIYWDDLPTQSVQV